MKDRDLEEALRALRAIAALAGDDGALDEGKLDGVKARLGTMMTRDWAVLNAVVDLANETVFAIDARAAGRRSSSLDARIAHAMAVDDDH